MSLILGNQPTSRHRKNRRIKAQELNDYGKVISLSSQQIRNKKYYNVLKKIEKGNRLVPLKLIYHMNKHLPMYMPKQPTEMGR